MAHRLHLPNVIAFDMGGTTAKAAMIEKGAIKRDVSIHVRFVHDETCFRFVKRLDGQPIPTAPLTPYKGAAGEKHSPFVTLAARA